VRARFVERLAGALGERAQVLASSASHGRVAAIALPGVDVYPVYRALVDRGVSVKCIKKSVPCVETGGLPLEVLRVGFPWWFGTDAADHAVHALVGVLHDQSSREALLETRAS
jgi:hypothetical protein